jgi:predicted aspartyl protease
MIYTYEYDFDYFGPAFPVVEIEVSSPSSKENKLGLRALVDSGADITMIPVRHLQRVGARVVDKRRLQNSANVSYSVDIYGVSLKMGPFYNEAIAVVGNRQSNEVIVGRDVLNHLIVTLNGLAGVTEITD